MEKQLSEPVLVVSCIANAVCDQKGAKFKERMVSLSKDGIEASAMDSSSSRLDRKLAQALRVSKSLATVLLFLSKCG